MVKISFNLVHSSPKKKKKLFHHGKRVQWKRQTKIQFTQVLIPNDENILPKQYTWRVKEREIERNGAKKVGAATAEH